MFKQNENTPFKQKKSINCQGNLLDFSTAKVMGILNLSYDSFFDGGQFSTEKEVLAQVSKLLHEGADIIDIGAFSSRPGATLISLEEELNRLLPRLKAIKNEFPNALLSVDTYRSEIAKIAVFEGASIINDISGGEMDAHMFETVAKLKAPYVMMHMKGSPQTMQKNPHYENVVLELFEFFQKKIKTLVEMGHTDHILDPGFGFGKTLSHNYQLLKGLHHFEHLDCPILVGMSRKKMVQQVIEQEAAEALNGTSVAHTIALMNGANILRVHDVKQAKEAVAIVAFMQKQ